MSDDNKKNDDKNDFDPYDFFKLDLNDEKKDKKDGKKPNNPKKFPFFSILIIAIALVFILNTLFVRKSENIIDYSKFLKMIDDGQIVRVDIGENYLIGYGPDAQAVADEDIKFFTPKAENSSAENSASGEKTDNSTKLNALRNRMKDESETVSSQIYKTNTLVISGALLNKLDEKGLEYKFVQKPNNYWFQLILSWVIPIGLLFLMYYFIYKKMGAGGMGSVLGTGGKSKAIDEGKVKTRFSDVAGVDEAKEELMEVVDFLKSPKKYTDIGGKIPKGVLLVGPPGTGKTLLARAVAGEAGVPFFRISGSDFVEMFVGVGASRVRDLFKTAREKAPCIIFIDEIDALGKNRMNGYGGGNDEREQTLNQLLVEMDGFDNEKGLIVLAATNRADILDPALLRPGRFDRHVPVERPDVKGREEILRIHAKNVKIDDDVDFESIAHGTTGFAGADLANVVNEAALLAVRNGRKKVTMVDFNDAIDKVSIGLKKKSRKDNKKEMRLVSVHETGHALVGAFTPDHEPVNKITVVPRSHGVGGFTQYREQEEKNFLTRQDIINQVDSALGGRAAEQIMLGDVSTGASNDIAQATQIIRSMIVDYGMSDKFKNMTLGNGVLGDRTGEPKIYREFSEETQKYIDEEIARIMEERYQHVLEILTEHKTLLEYISNRLLEVETMDGKEFYEIIKNESHCKELMDKSAKVALEDKSKVAIPMEDKTEELKSDDKESKDDVKADDSEKEEKPKRSRKRKEEKSE